MAGRVTAACARCVAPWVEGQDGDATSSSPSSSSASSLPLHVHFVDRDGAADGYAAAAVQRLATSGLTAVAVSSSCIAGARDGSSGPLLAAFASPFGGGAAPQIIFCSDVAVHRTITDAVRNASSGRRGRGFTYVLAVKTSDPAPDKAAAVMVALVRDIVASARAGAVASEGASHSDELLDMSLGGEPWDEGIEVTVARAAQVRNADLLVAVV